MAVIVVNRMHLRRIRYIPQFMLASLRIARQAHRTPGFLGGRLRAEPGGGYWTLTIWRSMEDMAAFRDTGAHYSVVPKTGRWADEAVYGIWATDAAQRPSWRAAAAKVAEDPHFATLEHPSTAQREQRAPRAMLIGFDIRVPGARRRQLTLPAQAHPRAT